MSKVARGGCQRHNSKLGSTTKAVQRRSHLQARKTARPPTTVLSPPIFRLLTATFCCSHAYPCSDSICPPVIRHRFLSLYSSAACRSFCCHSRLATECILAGWSNWSRACSFLVQSLQPSPSLLCALPLPAISITVLKPGPDRLSRPTRAHWSRSSVQPSFACNDSHLFSLASL